jgi:hypothetical protein
MFWMPLQATSKDCALALCLKLWPSVDPLILPFVLYRTLGGCSGMLQFMGNTPPRTPIERRRSEPPENSLPGLLNGNRPHTRRETDLLRLRIQHWMKLAEAALEHNRRPKRRRAAYVSNSEY